MGHSGLKMTNLVLIDILSRAYWLKWLDEITFDNNFDDPDEDPTGLVTVAENKKSEIETFFG